MLCGLAGSLSVSAQVLPSETGGPYGQPVAAPSETPQTLPSELGGPYGQQANPAPISPLPAPPTQSPFRTPNSLQNGDAVPEPPVQPALPGATMTEPRRPAVLSPDVPEMPSGEDVQPSVELDTAIPAAPVTLLDEPDAGGSAVLSRMLMGTISKVQEYPVDLETILKLVETQNLPVRRELLGAKLQKNYFYQTLSELLPDGTATYTHTRFQGTIQIFGNETLDVYQTRIVPQLQATWTLYPGGTTVFEALAAKRRHKAAKVQVGETYQEQLVAAANDFYRLLEARVQVENIKAGIAEARSQVALNEARLRAGVGTKLDLMRAESQLNQQELRLIEAENAVAVAEQALLNRLDLDPNIALVPTVALAQPRLLVPLSLDSDELVAYAVQHNPTLQVAAAELKALSAEGKAVLSRIVPSVTLQTYINGTGPAYDQLGLGRFGGLTIQSNLFENLGTQIPLQYRANRLERRQREVELKILVRNLETQVVNAYLNSRAFARAILSAQDELAVAQEAYRLALGRYRAGLGINVDVLDAETALSVARASLASAILNFNQAQVNLVGSLGEASIPNLLNGLNLNESAKKPAQPEN